MPVVALDWIVSEALRWNLHYRRDTTMKKIAPGSAFWILERAPKPQFTVVVPDTVIESH
jgi:hypothetical protein